MWVGIFAAGVRSSRRCSTIISVVVIPAREVQLSTLFYPAWVAYNLQRMEVGGGGWEVFSPVLRI